MDRPSFAERLIAFAAVEGIFFQGPFGYFLVKEKRLDARTHIFE